MLAIRQALKCRTLLSTATACRVTPNNSCTAAARLTKYSTQTEERIFDIEDYDDFKSRVIDASNTHPVIVDFHARWCGPCKMLGPRLASAIENRPKFMRLAKVDVDEQGGLAEDYDIRSVPTVMAYVKGSPAESFTGNIDDNALHEFLDRAEHDYE